MPDNASPNSRRDGGRLARINAMRERRLAVLLTLRGLGCPVFDNEPAPLAVGINGQIVALLEGVHSPQDVGIFLGWWTRRPDYLEAVARGEPRRDLDGIAVQETEPGHREHAKERLAARCETPATSPA